MKRLHALRPDDVNEAIDCLIRFQRIRNESITWFDRGETALIVINPKHRDKFTALVDSIPEHPRADQA